MGKRTCSIDDCDRPFLARERCSRHYRQWYQLNLARPCSVEDCDRPCVARELCKRHHREFYPPRNGRVCSVPTCSEPHDARGWCSQHYEAWRRHGDPLAPIKARRHGCTVPDCVGKHYARGWCRIHYRNWKWNGDPTKRVKASPGQADFYLNGYHHIHVDGRIVIEHRWVMEQHLGRPLLPGEEVHHRNGRRAQNEIGNLELWAISQPKGQRAADLLAWAREIIARYEPIEDKL